MTKFTNLVKLTGGATGVKELYLNCPNSLQELYYANGAIATVDLENYKSLIKLDLHELTGVTKFKLVNPNGGLTISTDGSTYAATLSLAGKLGAAANVDIENTALTSIGLHNTVKDAVVRNNASMTAFNTGYSSTSVMETLDLSSNKALATITGLDNETKLTALSLYGDTALTELALPIDAGANLFVNTTYSAALASVTPTTTLDVSTLVELKTLTIGGHSFRNITASNLKKLTSISVGASTDVVNFKAENDPVLATITWGSSSKVENLDLSGDPVLATGFSGSNFDKTSTKTLDLAGDVKVGGASNTLSLDGYTNLTSAVLSGMELVTFTQPSAYTSRT